MRRFDSPYCILHGAEALLSGQATSDIDLALDARDLIPFERAVMHAPGTHVVQMLQHESSGFCFVVRRHENGRSRLVAYDVATDFRCNGRIYLKATEMLRGRLKIDGIQVASPDVELAYLFAKRVSKLAMPDAQAQRLRELYFTVGAEAQAILTRLFGNAWAARVAHWLATQDWTSLREELHALNRAMRRRALRRAPMESLRFWFAELGRAWRRWHHPTGVLVAIVGPDGVGKSAVVEALRGALSSAFRQLRQYHFRPCLVAAGPDRGPVTDPHAHEPYGIARSLLKLAIYLTDCGLGYVLAIRPALTRTSLVLFDRYVDDLAVDPRRYRYGGPRWLARLASWVTPRPDLILILDAPEEVLLARKREVAPVELRRQRVEYRALADRLENAVLVDAARPLPEVVDQAAGAILDWMGMRYKSRRPLWHLDRARPAAAAAVETALALGSGVRAVAGRGTSQNGWTTVARFSLVELPEGRRLLLPRGRPSAARAALDIYNAQSRRARWGKRVLQAALWSGLGELLLPSIALQVRSGAEDLATARLMEVLGRDDLSFAVSLGTPSPRQKPLFWVMDPTGRAVAVAKIGIDPWTNGLVENNSRALATLSTARIQSVEIPRLLYTDDWGDRSVCITNAPVGPLLDGPAQLGEAHLALLAELQQIGATRVPLIHSAWWRDLGERVEHISAAHHRALAQRAMERTASAFGEQVLLFGAAHGDFAPWNTRLTGERLLVFDWEHFAHGMPPLWDAIHFVHRVLSLLDRLDPLQTARALSSGPSRRTLDLAQARLGHGDLPLDALVLLYFIDGLAKEASAEPMVPTELWRITAIIRRLVSDERAPVGRNPSGQG